MWDETAKVLKCHKKWCCQTGLNCRPLHYQWSALPLSYGSMPRIPDSAKKGRYKAADPCHKAPSRASMGPVSDVVKKGRNQEEAAAASFSRLSCGPIRFPIS